MRTALAVSIIIAAFAASFLIRSLLITPQSTDDAPSSPQTCARAVCLSPGLTETMFALGLGDRVVGVTRFCLYPDAAQDRLSVGGFLDPNYEAVVALRPDMVLVTPYQQELAVDLQRLGMTVHAVSQDSLADIRDSYHHIAALCGNDTRADVLVAELDTTISRLVEARHDKSRPRVLMTTGRDVRSNALDEIYAVGRGTFLDELLTLAGGENIAPGGALEYPALSGESILRLDPDIIIELVADQEEEAGLRATALGAWRALPRLRATRDNRVYVLFGAHLTVPGPRVTQTLEALARCLDDADGAENL